MTEERLAQLEALCRQATPGPWKARHRHVGNPSNDFAWDESAGLGWEIEELDRPMRGQFVRGADAHFIAEARTALPEALAEVRRLRGQQAQIQEVLRDRDDANPFATIQAILDDNEEVPHD